MTCELKLNIIKLTFIFCTMNHYSDDILAKNKKSIREDKKNVSKVQINILLWWVMICVLEHNPVLIFHCQQCVEKKNILWLSFHFLGRIMIIYRKGSQRILDKYTYFIYIYHTRRIVKVNCIFRRNLFSTFCWPNSFEKVKSFFDHFY